MYIQAPTSRLAIPSHLLYSLSPEHCHPYLPPDRTRPHRTHPRIRLRRRRQRHHRLPSLHLRIHAKSNIDRGPPAPKLRRRQRVGRLDAPPVRLHGRAEAIDIGGEVLR